MHTVEEEIGICGHVIGTCYGVANGNIPASSRRSVKVQRAAVIGHLYSHGCGCLVDTGGTAGYIANALGERIQRSYIKSGAGPCIGERDCVSERITRLNVGSRIN